jgi:hypothetical protein
LEKRNGLAFNLFDKECFPLTKQFGVNVIAFCGVRTKSHVNASLALKDNADIDRLHALAVGYVSD